VWHYCSNMCTMRGNVQHLSKVLKPWYHVKVYGPYSLSKDALRKEGTPWLIKCLDHVSLGDVRHFNTPPHVWQLWLNTCSTSGRKCLSSSKELVPIPYKSLWVLLTLKRLIERGCDTIAYKVSKSCISWRCETL
jgi:hypothetical protein